MHGHGVVDNKADIIINKLRLIYKLIQCGNHVRFLYKTIPKLLGKWQVGQKIEEEEEAEESLNLGIVIPVRTMYNVFGREFNWN